MELIDLAIKAGGLNVAEAGVTLARKIDNASMDAIKNKPLEVEK